MLIRSSITNMLCCKSGQKKLVIAIISFRRDVTVPLTIISISYPLGLQKHGIATDDRMSCIPAASLLLACVHLCVLNCLAANCCYCVQQQPPLIIDAEFIYTLTSMRGAPGVLQPDGALGGHNHPANGLACTQPTATREHSSSIACLSQQGSQQPFKVSLPPCTGTACIVVVTTALHYLLQPRGCAQ